MGRKPAPQPLALSDATATSGESLGARQTIRQVHSPTTATSSPTSPLRSPRSPLSSFRLGSKRSPRERDTHAQQDSDASPRSRQLRKSSPTPSPSLAKSDASTRRQSQILPHNPPPQHHQLGRDTEATSPFLPLAAALHDASLGTSSDPLAPGGGRMSREAENPGMAATAPNTDASTADHSVQKPNPSPPSKSDLSLTSVEHETPGAQQTGPKKPKTKPFGLLGRSKSQRDKDRNRSLSREREPAVPTPVRANDSIHLDRSFSQNHSGLRTAPIQAHDRSLREMMSSAVRNRSEDRASLRDAANKETQGKEQYRTQAPSSRDNGGTFLSGLRNSSTKAAGMIRDGLFGKSQRTTTPDKEPAVDDEHYVIKVINLPLVEQTRKTRISKRLEDSRDKTEFWMPAFPWRAIDYLNYKGCDVEGLYRVPGSGPQIKKWQRKFDEEYDVDLFAQDDLYDINIIGSMLKAWLRELPDELFPKDAQDRIARECAGAETVPQMLIDELSALSPFNYYLLFAITCHLSLLLAHSDKNKMDFRNLCICFQPCMKIDVFCFKFLVCDWRNCWKGCKLEPKFIEEEYKLFDQPPPRGLADTRKPSAQQQQEQQQQQPQPSQQTQQTQPPPPTVEEPAPSSSDGGSGSSAPSQEPPRRSRKKRGANGSKSSPSTNLTINSERAAPRAAEDNNDLRPLSPIKPLSPMNF